MATKKKADRQKKVVSSGVNPVNSGGNSGKLQEKPPGKANAGLFTPKSSGKKVVSPRVSVSGQQPPALKPGDPGYDSGAVDPTRPIGKGNPPRPDPKHQFKPGKSGNPAGYPKGQPNGSTIIKYWLGQKEALVNPISQKSETLSQVDIMTLQMIVQARKGNVTAFRELMDRTEGKPVQSTKLLNADDKLLEVFVGFRAPAPAPPPPAATKPPKVKKPTKTHKKTQKPKV